MIWEDYKEIVHKIYVGVIYICTNPSFPPFVPIH